MANDQSAPEARLLLLDRMGYVVTARRDQFGSLAQDVDMTDHIARAVAEELAIQDLTRLGKHEWIPAVREQADTAWKMVDAFISSHREIMPIDKEMMS